MEWEAAESEIDLHNSPDARAQDTYEQLKRTVDTLLDHSKE